MLRTDLIGLRRAVLMGSFARLTYLQLARNVLSFYYSSTPGSHVSLLFTNTISGKLALIRADCIVTLQKVT
jgi:hypothetical protein